MADKDKLQLKKSLASNDENEIVRRVPVYLGNLLKKKIQIIKFPLRSDNRHYIFDEEIEKMESFQIKPKSNKIMMKFRIKTDSNHFNLKNAFPQKDLVLKSRLIPNRCNYAVGRLINDKLILIPAEQTLQMLPDFFYIAQADSNSKNKPLAASTDKIQKIKIEKTTKDSKKSSKNPPEKESSKEEMTAVVQKMQKIEKTSHMSTFMGFKDHFSLIEGEPWSELKNLNKKTMKRGESLPIDSLYSVEEDSESEEDRLERSNNEFLNLLRKMSFKGTVKSDVNGEKFLNFLKKNEYEFGKSGIEEIIIEPEKIKKGLSKDYIRNNLKNYEHKVLAILKNCYSITYTEIRRILWPNKKSEKPSETNLLVNALKAVAYFVHGVWIVKSQFVYEGREKFASDFLISLFWRNSNRAVNRSEWNSISKLDNESSKKILTNISSYNKTEDMWVLKRNSEIFDLNAVPRDLLESQNKILEKTFCNIIQNSN